MNKLLAYEDFLVSKRQQTDDDLKERMSRRLSNENRIKGVRAVDKNRI